MPKTRIALTVVGALVATNVAAKAAIVAKSVVLYRGGAKPFVMGLIDNGLAAKSVQAAKGTGRALFEPYPSF